MKIIFCAMFFFAIINSKGQSTKIDTLNCFALINIDFKREIPLYDNKAKIIKKLKHNFKGEDYIVLNIIGKNDSMYKVAAIYSIAGFIAKGWVKKNHPAIGIYSRAYSTDLNLFKYPKKSSEIQSTIKEYFPDFLHVGDCQNNWFFIDVKIKNKAYSGWIAPEMQCANAYSNCN